MDDTASSSVKRRRVTLESPSTPGNTPGNVLNKGLRHFSMRVCAKVEEKGCTTYNEVADELVTELLHSEGLSKVDHKNIRRRVYDALNVLMAMDIIKKEKKEIRWLGLPNDLENDSRAYELEKMAREKRIAQKTRVLQEMLLRQIALHQLVSRNAQQWQSTQPSDRLHLPFILIHAPRRAKIHCEMLEDRTQYAFAFSHPFVVQEDMTLLRMMGLCQPTTREALKACCDEEMWPFLPEEIVSPVMKK